MSLLLNNKILQAAERSVESKLLPGTKDDYMKIVVSGMRAGLADGPNGILAGLRQSKDPVRDAAVGAVNLVMMLRHQSRGTMPANAIPPAASTLMLQALDFIDKSRIKKIGAKDLDRATHILTNQIFNVFRITPAMLKGAATKVHGVMQNPEQMQMIARKAGVVKDPRAAAVPNGFPLATGGKNG